MKYYIISGDKVRKERVEKRLKDQDIKDYTFIDAIFPNDEEYKKMATCHVDRVGVFGCFRSHLKAMRQLCSSNEEGCIICEDDVLFCPSFKDKSQNIVNKYPFNLILFSPYISASPYFTDNKVDENIYLLEEKIYSTTCYYIKKSYAQHVLSVYDRPFHLYHYTLRRKACDELFTLQSGGVYTYPPLAVEDCISTSIDNETMVVLKRHYWSGYGFENYGTKEDIQASLQSCCNIIANNASFFDNNFKYVEKIVQELLQLKEWPLLKKLTNISKVVDMVCTYFNKGHFKDCLAFFSDDISSFNNPIVYDCICLATYYENKDIVVPLSYLLQSSVNDNRIKENITHYTRRAKEQLTGKYISFKPMGRLGNQLFQYFAAYALGRKTNRQVVATSPHLLHNVLPFIPYCPYLDFETLYTPLGYTELKEDKSFILQGYMQSHKYFEQYRDDILSLVIKRQYKRKNNKQHVAVHVRRSDYLHSHHFYVVPNLTYYQQAMQQFTNCQFVVFSDDKEWCKQNFKGDNISIFEEKVKDEEELLIMSSMDHFIICNSTFSWWASWLGQYKDKKVILPNRWFIDKEKNDEMRDVYYSNCFKLDTKLQVSILLPLADTKYIKECIDSLKEQTYEEFECLVGYTDAKLCQDVANIVKDDKRFTFKQYEDLSHNVMVKDSKYDILCFINCQDYWHKEKLQKQIKIIQMGQYDIIATQHNCIGPESKNFISLSSIMLRKYACKADIDKNYTSLIHKEKFYYMGDKLTTVHTNC